MSTSPPSSPSMGSSPAKGKKKTSSSAGGIIGPAVFLSLAAFTGMLGYWQLKRRKWKVDLIDSRTKKLQMDPIPLEEVLRSMQEGDTFDGAADDALEFRQVTVEGVLDYSQEMIVGPRSAPTHLDSKLAGMRGGFFIITPMRLTNGGPTILVNRGWVRSDQKDIIHEEKLMKSAKGEGRVVTLSGVLRDAETPSSFLPQKGEATGRNWLYIDPNAMMETAVAKGFERRDAEENEVETLLLDVLSPQSSDQPGRLWPVRKSAKDYVNYHTTPQMHSVYAGTWFSLAAAIVGLTFMRFRSSAEPAVATTARYNGSNVEKGQ